AGAARHRSGLAEPAATTLLRLDDGSLTDCAQCGQRLGFDRLDALPGVVSCAAAGAPPPTGPTPVRTGRGRCP
ncbi:MAG: hypothetical protein JWN08_3072, partial [Frankiales bacterium]|nr:hypothetical protein [Frankiales bacterium]